MKKTITRLAAILVISALALTPACKKAEKGDKGDKGDTGATGPAGPQGNAEVYGYFFSVDLNQFVKNSSNNRWECYYNIAPTTGTVTIGDKDAVLVYLNDPFSTSTDYYMLPYDYYFNTSTDYIHFYYSVESFTGLNWITLGMRNNNGLQPYTTMSGTLYYKLVIIKAVNRVKPTLPKDLSYENIKKYYHLKD